jgi:hypothetical protein
MTDPTTYPTPGVADGPIPPPRRRRTAPPLGLDAVQVIPRRGLLPRAASVVGLALRSHRRLPAGTRGPGHPLVYSQASIRLLALLGRLWHLSTREVCLWLARWPRRASACGLPPGRVIQPAQLARRVRRRGAYPCWLLALVWRAVPFGRQGPRLRLHSPRAAGPRRPAAERLLALSCQAQRPALRVSLARVCPLRAGPAHPRRPRRRGVLGLGLVRGIATALRARPLIPFNRQKPPLARGRHLVWYRLSYAKRTIIERCFAAAKRYFERDTRYPLDGEAVLLRVTLTFCAILVVALAAHQAGAPDLRLSPTRVLAHYQPIDLTL